MTGHSGKIVRNATVVAAATLVSRILGFARDLIVAATLGAGLFADAFFVAFRIPNLLRRLFGEGSLTMAFIPVYTRARTQEGDEAADRMARSTQAWLTVILSVVTLAAVLFSDGLTAVIAPGFLSDPELTAFTSRLVRIVFPYSIFICSVALCMGVLNSRDHFLAPALAPCVLNLCLIGAALFGWLTGRNVALCMSVGVLAAGLGQWLLQQPFLRRIGFNWRGPWTWKDPNVFRVGRLMLPTVLGAAVYQINIVFGTLLASFLPTGSVSYLYYADRLVQFPLGVFGIAVSTAALPSLAALAAENRPEEFLEALQTAVNLTLFISLPAMAGLMALSEPVIGLLFGRGAFTPEAVGATASALTAYAVGLPFIAISRPLVSAFYAHQDTRTPVAVAIICLLVNIGLGWTLMQWYAHVGLAVAVSASSMANALLLAVLLRRKLSAKPVTWGTPLKCLLLGCVVGVGAWATRNMGIVWALCIPVWIVVYFFGALALRVPEAALFRDMAVRRIRRKQPGRTQYKWDLWGVWASGGQKTLVKFSGLSNFFLITNFNQLFSSQIKTAIYVVTKEKKCHEIQFNFRKVSVSLIFGIDTELRSNAGRRSSTGDGLMDLYVHAVEDKNILLLPLEIFTNAAHAGSKHHLYQEQFFNPQSSLWSCGLPQCII